MKSANRIQTAIGRIVVREPFFASILLGMEIEETETIPTFGTNGLAIKFNPKFASTLTDEELITVLVHEVEHVARLHPWRRNNREQSVWNKACDYSINQELTDAKFILPKCGLIDPSFSGMAEEEIYGKLASQTPQPGNEPGEGEGNDPSQQPGNDPSNFGAVEDCPGTEAEKNAAEQKTKVEIIRAATIAKQQGRLPASMASIVDEIKHPKVSWQELLRNYLTSYARDDYSWARPNRRYEDTGFMLPSLHNHRCGTIAVAIDTSGSIGQSEFSQFIGELKDIIESMKPERTIFVQCDSQVQDWRILQSGETLDPSIELCGGGGTSFEPVFNRITDEGESPEVLVYLTDGYGSFPDDAPAYEVIWAMTTDVKAPFGQTVKVEMQ